MSYVVAFYEIDRQYGGPEEGGWWYDSGDLVRVFHVARSEEQAYRVASRANRLLKVIQRNKRSVSSVIYSGGRYSAYVYENTAPRNFPEETPYYE